MKADTKRAIGFFGVTFTVIIGAILIALSADLSTECTRRNAARYILSERGESRDARLMVNFIRKVTKIKEFYSDSMKITACKIHLSNDMELCYMSFGNNIYDSIMCPDRLADR